MAGFERDPSGRALLGGFPLAEAAAHPELTTPLYLYDLDGIAAAARALVEALGSDNLVAYAMKANSAASVLRQVAAAGAGADVVSGAELKLALATGIAPKNVLMSGVAKTNDEIDLAITSDIRALQVESVEELARVEARAQTLGKPAPVTPRVNPSVAIDSHSHIATGHDEAKFGILRSDLPRAWSKIDSSAWLTAAGVSSHVGSMLRKPESYLEAARVVCEIARERRAAGQALSYVNFGGGFGIDYGGAPAASPPQFAQAALELLREFQLEGTCLCVEPGRSLVGPYGVVLARVTQSKVATNARWLMLDAGMNDLLRPALYQAKHRIEALEAPPSGDPWRAVGPVCESSDDFGQHQISESVPSFVVIRDAGAYGYVMASEYNGRALPAEAFISDGKLIKVSRPSSADRWLRERLDA